MKSRALLPLLLTSVAFAADPALTIYNGDFAVVRDAVPLKLEAGINTVTYANATAQLEPDSVILRDPAGKVPLQILEQNYRNDPVSQELLLSLFEGQTIGFEVKTGDEVETVQGKIVRSGYEPGADDRKTQPVIEVNGQLRFSLPGEPLFPALGDNTVLKPTLVWQIGAPEAAQLEGELAYVTGGLSWKADYNIVAPEKGDTSDLVGWITMKNQSGKTFPNARIKLMAGDVHKIQPTLGDRERAVPGTLGHVMVAEAVEEKAFDSYHLYTLPRPATLRDQETKQVEFTRASGVPARRIYVYEPTEGLGIASDEPALDPNGGVTAQQPVHVFVEFKNSEENKLGIPLPKGRMRFYRRDGEQLEFVGENEIPHTPKDEMIKLELGNAFDLVGERKRTNFAVNSKKRMADESFEIKLRNRGKQAAEIRVVEHLYRWSGWQIAAASSDFTKTDASTIEFRTTVQPDLEKVITYTVHYAW